MLFVVCLLVVWLFQIDNALPSLMIYCNGEVRGNFVRITDELGSSYEDEDLEQFLQTYVRIT